MTGRTLHLPPTTVFCDVRTDLADAARIFGPQKGARPKTCRSWPSASRGSVFLAGRAPAPRAAWARSCCQLGAELVDGGERMLDVLDFAGACRGVDAVVTGEGRLDASSLEGKLPVVVARRARALGLRVVGRFGRRGDGWERAAALFDEVSFEMN